MTPSVDQPGDTDPEQRRRGRTYWLIGPDGQQYASGVPGSLGGNRRQRLYGRLDCPAALRALARGSYAASRVFFADSGSAAAAGYRPPLRSLSAAQYQAWRVSTRETAAGPESR